MDSIESHRRFVSRHGLHDLTLLSDTEGKIAEIYDADHWLFPVASRTYLIVDKERKILFREKTGIFPLKDQTKTLLREIDKGILPRADR